MIFILSYSPPAEETAHADLAMCLAAAADSLARGITRGIGPTGRWAWWVERSALKVTGPDFPWGVWIYPPNRAGTGWERPQFEQACITADEAHVLARSLRQVWPGHLVAVRPLCSPPKTCPYR